MSFPITATSTFLSLPFAWSIFFHPLTFNLYVSGYRILSWQICFFHYYLVKNIVSSSKFLLFLTKIQRFPLHVTFNFFSLYFLFNNLSLKCLNVTLFLYLSQLLDFVGLFYCSNLDICYLVFFALTIFFLLLPVHFFKTTCTWWSLMLSTVH